MVEADKEDLEDLGLLKLDVLGVWTLARSSDVADDGRGGRDRRRGGVRAGVSGNCSAATATDQVGRAGQPD
jgi:hypothetical protein